MTQEVPASNILREEVRTNSNSRFIVRGKGSASTLPPPKRRARPKERHRLSAINVLDSRLPRKLPLNREGIPPSSYLQADLAPLIDRVRSLPRRGTVSDFAESNAGGA